ncbi:MAG: Bacterio-opsin activator domain protein, partial [Bacilli bacterium]|nr:Bacterio-opsin activator domain protein [Bacilli bacterium]
MMGSLKEALSIERSRLFVGRKTELAYMQNWLEQQRAPTEVVFISGMGGIGKTALLLQFLNMAQDENMLCIWLDGRVCTETPAGFLEYLHSFLFRKSSFTASSKPSMLEIVTAMTRKRTLLCIDNYEHLQRIEGWLREVFLPELSATGLIVVLASRQDVAINWQNDLAWGTRVRQMNLSPISQLEAQDFYLNIGLANRPEIERLVYETKGLPLAMALSAETAMLTNIGEQTFKWPVSRLVSAELLREVARSDLQEILDVLCILPQANTELLNRVLGGHFTTLQLHQLSQLSFVRPTMDGFALHDVAREHLYQDFLQREPVRYQTLRLRIVEDACRQLKKAAVNDKKRIAADLLSICRDSFYMGSISLMSSNTISITMESFRNEDLPHLHRLITEEGQMAIPLESNAKIHQLLDALAEQFPEAIRVFRSAAGIPLTFIAGVLLYRETFAFLEPFIPHVLDCCLPLEANSIKQLPHEEADTYYQLLGASTSSDPDYTYYELNGILLTDTLSLNSAVG